MLDIHFIYSHLLKYWLLIAITIISLRSKINKTFSTSAQTWYHAEYLSSWRQGATAVRSPAAVHQPVARLEQSLTQGAPQIPRTKDTQQLPLRVGCDAHRRQRHALWFPLLGHAALSVNERGNNLTQDLFGGFDRTKCSCGQVSCRDPSSCFELWLFDVSILKTDWTNLALLLY